MSSNPPARKTRNAALSHNKRFRKFEERQDQFDKGVKALAALQQKIHSMSMVMVGAVMLLNKKYFLLLKSGSMVPAFVDKAGKWQGPDGIIEPEDIVSEAKIISDNELTEIISKVAQEHGTVQSKENESGASGSEDQSEEGSNQSSNSDSSGEESELPSVADSGTDVRDSISDGHGADRQEDETDNQSFGVASNTFEMT